MAFQSLRSHHGGEGYLSQRIIRAELLEASLFYNNKSTFNFEAFPSRMEEMFRIYKEENQEKLDKEKISIFFRKIQSSIVLSMPLPVLWSHRLLKSSHAIKLLII